MKNYCKRCQQETNHKSLKEEVVKFREDYYCDEHYMIIQCEGCDDISFKYEFHDIEAGYPGENDEWYVPIEIETYPKVIKMHKQISELYYVPNIVKDAYIQSISAYKEDAKILAGLGFRAVIEAICNDRGIQGSNLAERIDKMANLGIISRNNANLLHAIRFLGNDAAHEIKSPNENALNVTLKIIEHMIQSLYILEKEANNVMDTILESFDSFTDLLDKRIMNFKCGDEIPLAKILQNDIRRFKGQLSNMERKLEENIRKGEYTKLSLGKVGSYDGLNKSLQHYIVV